MMVVEYKPSKSIMLYYCVQIREKNYVNHFVSYTLLCSCYLLFSYLFRQLYLNLYLFLYLI